MVKKDFIKLSILSIVILIGTHYLTPPVDYEKFIPFFVISPIAYCIAKSYGLKKINQKQKK